MSVRRFIAFHLFQRRITRFVFRQTQPHTDNSQTFSRTISVDRKRFFHFPGRFQYVK